MDYGEENVICRVCLKKLTENCEPIEEIVQHTFNYLTLCPNFVISDDPMMCVPCAMNLKKCFDFKARCLSTEDCVASFAEGEDKKVDLRDVYSKVKLDGYIDKVPNDHSVCRFCLILVKDDASTSVRHDEDLIAILQKCFLEMDLRITDDIIACTPCYNSLRFYVTFVNNYLSIEEKINEYCIVEGTNYKGQVDLREVATFTSKNNMVSVENINSLIIKEDKHENTVNTNVGVKVKFEDPTDVEQENKKLIKEEIQSNNNSFQRHPSPSQSDQAHITYKDDTQVTMYECYLCKYQTKWKSSLKRHMLTHKTHSEISTYKCDLCDYEAKVKFDCKRHMLTHKTPSEITMYKCDLCNYKVKHKRSLERHMLSHNPNLETIMYKCETCDYETKNKFCLRRHMLNHKDVSEIEMHQCEVCLYETKHKDRLQKHMLIHKDVSEIEMYKCKVCPFEAKRKQSLQRHMLSHRQTHSKIGTYRCETCAYETRRKDNLQEHMLIHTDVSEMEVHKCKVCPYKTKWKRYLHHHMLSHIDTADVVT